MKRKKLVKKNNYFCAVCGGIGKIKIIKNVIQIGPYHLGKEILEKCNFCKNEGKIAIDINNNENVLH